MPQTFGRQYHRVGSVVAGDANAYNEMFRIARSGLTNHATYLELQECLHREALAKLVHELALHSGAPLVALGCDYFYAPEERAGRAVLIAIERKDGDLARAFGAPDDFVADFLNALEPDLP